MRSFIMGMASLPFATSAHEEFLEASSKQVEVSKHDSGLIASRLRRQFTIASSLKAAGPAPLDPNAPDVCYSEPGDLLIKTKRDAGAAYGQIVNVVKRPPGLKVPLNKELALACSLTVINYEKNESQTFPTLAHITYENPPFERVPPSLKQDILMNMNKNIETNLVEMQWKPWKTYNDRMITTIKEVGGFEETQMRVYNMFSVQSGNVSFKLLVGRFDNDFDNDFKKRPTFLKSKDKRHPFEWEVIKDNDLQHVQQLEVLQPLPNPAPTASLVVLDHPYAKPQLD